MCAKAELWARRLQIVRSTMEWLFSCNKYTVTKDSYKSSATKRTRGLPQDSILFSIYLAKSLKCITDLSIASLMRCRWTLLRDRLGHRAERLLFESQCGQKKKKAQKKLSLPVKWFLRLPRSLTDLIRAQNFFFSSLFYTNLHSASKDVI